MRIIIFEGCDRTGKSTCINELSKYLENEGFNPFVFHLMGPNKFENYSFNNDEKSLLQLSKFDDEYYLFDEILKKNKKNIIILDRSHFGEYVWTKFWNRTGKYTNLLFEDSFVKKHSEIFKEILYINFYISDINILSKRIKESEEDLKIFTTNNKTVEENIEYVYDLFNELEKNHVIPLNISYVRFDNSGKLEKSYDFANNLKELIKKAE